MGLLTGIFCSIHLPHHSHPQQLCLSVFLPQQSPHLLQDLRRTFFNLPRLPLTHFPIRPRLSHVQNTDLLSFVKCLPEESMTAIGCETCAYYEKVRGRGQMELWAASRTDWGRDSPKLGTVLGFPYRKTGKGGTLKEL
ncbi:hypothetical protein BT69DRAFT_56486 [Atractiella rhizophila]|nr:hypothetical protein BT69DRAFT_56486 [Atractiella rhizophila]